MTRMIAALQSGVRDTILFPMPQRLDREALRALVIGLGLAVGVLLVPFLRFVLGYLTILVHELGHAAAGWLFGYPSIPAFDFRYGGGLTSHESRKIVIVLLVLGALGYAMWYCREHRAALTVVGAVTALYALFAFTPSGSRRTTWEFLANTICMQYDVGSHRIFLTCRASRQG